MKAISVRNLGKAYKKYSSWGARLAECFNLQRKKYHRLDWVLKDINFEARRGEAIGIIGVNGAGKSTLLRMISGITRPTTGDVEVNGRLSAIMELGMAFHPDFTGRQNVVLEGQLRGLSQNQTIELMPNIESFADIGTYFDEPVRLYSSGMIARIAFAVATLSKPDILIVDETLSVGDIAFQAKCILKMNNLLSTGTCILFVSHAMNQVRQFCSRAIYISNNKIKSMGSVEEICDLYQNDLVGNKSTIYNSNEITNLMPNTLNPSSKKDSELRKNSVGGDSGGTLELEFTSFCILNINGKRISKCSPGETVFFKADIISNKIVTSGAAVGLLIADKKGVPLLSCNSNYYNVFLPKMKKGALISISWEITWPFHSGEFRIDIGIKPDPFTEQFYDRVFCASTIESCPPLHLLKSNFGGYLHVDANINVSKIYNDMS